MYNHAGSFALENFLPVSRSTRMVPSVSTSHAFPSCPTSRSAPSPSLSAQSQKGRDSPGDALDHWSQESPPHPFADSTENHLRHRFPMGCGNFLAHRIIQQSPGEAPSPQRIPSLHNNPPFLNVLHHRAILIEGMDFILNQCRLHGYLWQESIHLADIITGNPSCSYLSLPDRLLNGLVCRHIIGCGWCRSIMSIYPISSLLSASSIACSAWLYWFGYSFVCTKISERENPGLPDPFPHFTFISIK